jgi:hypothetical protein
MLRRILIHSGVRRRILFGMLVIEIRHGGSSERDGERVRKVNHEDTYFPAPVAAAALAPAVA